MVSLVTTFPGYPTHCPLVALAWQWAGLGLAVAQLVAGLVRPVARAAVRSLDKDSELVGSGGLKLEVAAVALEVAVVVAAVAVVLVLVL